MQGALEDDGPAGGTVHDLRRALRHPGVAIVLALAAWWTGPSAAATRQAHAQAAEHGQAYLFTRLAACYALIPTHVLGADGDGYAALTAGGDRFLKGDGDLVFEFGYDLSLLEVSGRLGDQCQDRFERDLDLTDLLQARGLATVSSVNADGSISRRTAIVDDVGPFYLRLAPRGDDDRLFQGLSGSLVTVDARPVGLLMSVDTQTGSGTALRLDRAYGLVAAFFGQARDRPAEPAPRDRRGEGREPAPGDQDVAAAANGGELIAWSADAVDAEHRAARLIGAAGPGYWQARAPRFPVSLTLDLAGDEAHPVSAIELDGAAVPEAGWLPRDIEVLASPTHRERWTSVAAGTLSRGQRRYATRISPVFARRIKLVIYSTWDAGDTLALGRIRVLAD